MDEKEMQLLEKYINQDEEIKRLWEEHQLFEKQLEKLESKSFLTPAEEQHKREIKKQKLGGKTKLVNLLNQYKEL